MRADYGLVAAVTLIVALPPQGAAPRRLGAPTATLEQEFTGVDGVRELRDGRVIVLDARDKAIHVIDLKTKAGKRIGREGDGPGEYRLPRSFLASRADSTLIWDAARFDRFVVITPAGEMGGLVYFDSARGQRTAAPSAADAAGRIYYRSYGQARDDSMTIIRWSRSAGKRDTVARYWGRTVSPLPIGAPVGPAPPGMSARVPTRPFSTIDQWAVAPDGRIAIVTPEPYRVTYINPDGKRTAGPVMAVAVISVGDAEKDEYLKEQQRPVATISEDRNGVRTTSYRRRTNIEVPEAWPAALPAFVLDALSFASDGMLWVKRSVKAGAPVLYDVFDPAARLAYQLELPPKRKLVGFGAGVVYLARVDDDDLHYLERYTLPATRPIAP